ncbi:MAG: hypothetical protein KGJ80_00450 [Chloroflexota bacterium]|nr:hypothetical protein [Chloroflexota bacterium]
MKDIFVGLILLLLITACAAPSEPPVATPSPMPIENSDAAIAATKTRYPEVAKIQKTGAGLIGASTNITTLERADGWDLVFWEGWGDCPAGCINNRYYYFSVKKDGTIIQAGEYARNYNANTNSFDTSGVPMWGIPRIP